MSVGLAKVTLAGVVNANLVDVSHTIQQIQHCALITDKDPEGLEVIRHFYHHIY